MKFGGLNNRVRVVSRVPWSSWAGFSDGGTIVGKKTMWRLYDNANNWIVAEWDATLGGVIVRIKHNGLDKSISLGSGYRAMR